MVEPPAPGTCCDAAKTHTMDNLKLRYRVDLDRTR
jgi:hypothetical protein